MAFYTELPVYKDTYQLVLQVFEITRDFPREYRYTLGQDMKRDALHLLRCIYRANKHQNRAEHLEVFLDEIRVRIHLGVYILQQMFNLTDRVTEQQVRDNAAFQLFCGYGLIKKWHAPDHTKIEAFRSRLSPETQRRLANLITQHAVKLNYANPTDLDIDSTVQEANIAYPAIANLLVKVAVLASKVGKGLNQLCCGGMKRYHVGLSNLKQIALYYFMPDAQSLPMMLNTHEYLFGKGLLASVATDKGYYSLSNEQLLIEKGVLEIQLPRPDRILNAARETTLWTIRQLVYHRRAGIEPLIGHTKQGGQLGRSRMKSDATTKSAGYAAVFGFNLRQLTRCLAGEVRPKVDVVNNIAANNANII